MNLIWKSAIAATALAVGSLAQAAVPSVPPQPAPTPAGLPNGGANGPALVAVWDPLTGSSLVEYLGLNYNDLNIPDMSVAGTVLNFNTLTGFSTTFSSAIGANAASRLQYGVFALDTTSAGGFGLRATSTANFLAGAAGDQIQAAAGSYKGYITNVFNFVDFCNKVNPCSINSADQNNPTYFGSGVYGGTLGGGINGAGIGGNVGSALGFYQLTSDPDDQSADGFISAATGFWNLSTSGLLQYTVGGGGPGPDPVPLPAGVWLLISGLTGLGVLRRRAPAAA